MDQKWSATSLPVAGATVGMGYSEDLDSALQFAINEQKRKTTKHELARAVRVAWPALRRLSNELNCVGDLLNEPRSDKFIACKVPLDGGEEFANDLFVKLNFFCGHAGAQRRPGIGRPATRWFSLCQNPGRQRGGRPLLATRIRRLGPGTNPGCSARKPQGQRALLPSGRALAQVARGSVASC